MSAIIRATLVNEPDGWHVEPDVCPASDGDADLLTTGSPLRCQRRTHDGRYLWCPALEYCAVNDEGTERVGAFGWPASMARALGAARVTVHVSCRLAKRRPYRVGV